MSKEKKYFWLKLKTDFFQDARIKKLRKIAGGDTYTIIFQKIMLLSLANEGIIVFENIEDSLAEELSLILDEEEINVQVTLDYMAKHKMIEELEKGSFLVNSVQNLIGTESASKERVRRHRERKKLTSKEVKSVTCNDSVTEMKRREEKRREDKELEPKKEKKPIFNSLIVDYLIADEVELSIDDVILLEDFISYRREIKKPLKTYRPLKAYLKNLNAIQKELGISNKEAIEQMQLKEWQTVDVSYFKKDNPQNNQQKDEVWM